VLVFWLFHIVLCWNERAANRLSITVTSLAALALASALFVIIEFELTLR